VTREEQMQFIEKELKGLWPQWQPSDAELRVWMADLASLPYGLARAATQAYFRSQNANYQRPLPARFRERLRALRRPVDTRPAPPCEPMTDCFIECLEAPPDKPHLAGVRRPVFPGSQDDPDRIRACVAATAARFGRHYGGHWIGVTTRPQPEDGLRGRPAAQKARRNILNGPDTPGRRLLQSLLTRQAEPQRPSHNYRRMPTSGPPRSRHPDDRTADPLRAKEPISNLMETHVAGYPEVS
jgi:hypothetical protein